MDQVGVRDLKQNASRVLARVKAGEIVTGTQDVLATTAVAVAPGVCLSDDLAAMREGDRLVSSALARTELRRRPPLR
jgi:hypothetical protein